MNAPQAVPHEHAHHDTITEDIFYPDHPPRTESATFVATKKAGHAAQIPCAITGQTVKVEYHHVWCEWAFSGAVDWATVKAVGTGELTQLPVLDVDTHLPVPGRFYDVKDSLIWAICLLAEVKGFDWHAFDPTRPETFVDSPANMLVLHEKFHRMKGHGLHTETLPVWLFQAFPRVPGFIYSPDELEARHRAA